MEERFIWFTVSQGTVHYGGEAWWEFWVSPWWWELAVVASHVPPSRKQRAQAEAEAGTTFEAHL